MIACAIRQRVERQRSADRFSGRPDRVAGPTGSSTSRNKPDLNSVPVTLESGSGLCYVRTRFSCIFANYSIGRVGAAQLVGATVGARMKQEFGSRRGRGWSSAQNDWEPQPTGECNAASQMRQQGAEFYDCVHTESNIPATRALYYPLMRKVVESIQDHGSCSILEVGCGNGFLAEMLLQENRVSYRGFDFSPVAVRNAADRTGHPELFFRGDALDAQSYACDYDTIICTEVLEHIDADLDVIRVWRDGAWCVCTVPNFDFPSHVRFFRTPEQVAARYSGLIDIRTVIKVTRPIMPDGRVSSYWRNLRWSRNDPSRFLGFLGVQTFDRLGGWFLLCGTKKQRDG